MKITKLILFLLTEFANIIRLNTEFFFCTFFKLQLVHTHLDRNLFYPTYYEGQKGHFSSIIILIAKKLFILLKQMNRTLSKFIL